RLVEIKTSRENSLKAIVDRVPQSVLPLPGLNDDIARQIRMLNFIPANHFALMLREYIGYLTIKVSLQRVLIGKLLFLHKRFNRGVIQPMLRINLITANMNVSKGK